MWSINVYLILFEAINDVFVVLFVVDVVLVVDVGPFVNVVFKFSCSQSLFI